MQLMPGTAQIVARELGETLHQVAGWCATRTTMSGSAPTIWASSWPASTTSRSWRWPPTMPGRGRVTRVARAQRRPARQRSLPAGRLDRADPVRRDPQLRPARARGPQHVPRRAGPAGPAPGPLGGPRAASGAQGEAGFLTRGGSGGSGLARAAGNGLSRWRAAGPRTPAGPPAHMGGRMMPSVTKDRRATGRWPMTGELPVRFADVAGAAERLRGDRRGHAAARERGAQRAGRRPPAGQARAAAAHGLVQVPRRLQRDLDPAAAGRGRLLLRQPCPGRGAGRAPARHAGDDRHAGGRAAHQARRHPRARCRGRHLRPPRRRPRGDRPRDRRAHRGGADPPLRRSADHRRPGHGRPRARRAGEPAPGHARRGAGLLRRRRPGRRLCRGPGHARARRPRSTPSSPRLRRHGPLAGGRHAPGQRAGRPLVLRRAAGTDARRAHLRDQPPPAGRRRRGQRRRGGDRHAPRLPPPAAGGRARRCGGPGRGPGRPLPTRGRTIGVVVSGGNVDAELFARVLTEGQA